jgi:hypothetical protein
VFFVQCLGSDRLPYLAATGLLAAFLLAANWGAYAQGPSERETPTQAQQSQPASPASDELRPPPALVEPSPPVAPAEPIQGKPKIYDPDCAQPKDHDEADLCQQRRMSKAAEQALALTIIQTIVGTVGLLLVLLSLRFTVGATRSAAMAANAAQDQVRLTREALIVDQRAFVRVDFSIEGDSVFYQQGASIRVAAKITNIGKTTANFVRTNMEMVLIEYGRSEEAVLNAFCEANKFREPAWSRLLVPNDTYTRDWVVTIEIDRPDGLINPSVLVCVTYETIFDDGFHQTAFFYHLGTGEGDRYDGPIPVDQGDISRDNVVFSVGAGGTAT